MQWYRTSFKFALILLLLCTSRNVEAEERSEPNKVLIEAMLALNSQFFEADNKSVQEFIKTGTEAQFGPANFAFVVREMFGTDRTDDQLRLAARDSVLSGIDSAGSVYAMLVTGQPSGILADPESANMAKLSIEAVAIPGDASALLFSAMIELSVPEVGNGDSGFVSRQYVSALKRGSPIAISLGMRMGSPTDARVRMLCEILWAVASKLSKQCHNHELKFELRKESFSPNVRGFITELEDRFGDGAYKYRELLCSDLTGDFDAATVCADIISTALSICSLRSKDPAFNDLNNFLVCGEEHLLAIKAVVSQYLFDSLGLELQSTEGARQ